jgi:hypothetical protein
MTAFCSPSVSRFTHVFEQVGDEARLRLNLVNRLAACFDRRDLVLGLRRLREQILDLPPECGDVLAVIAHVLQVGAAARADLVHGLDLGLHRGDDRLALGNRLHLLVDVVRLLRELGHLRLDGGNFLLGERELRAALFELLEHRFRALDLVLGGLGLRHGVALPRLQTRELANQFVLGRA